MPRVAGGVGEHLGDVPVGVVVGVDRAVGVGRHAGGAQVAGGGEDRVFGVVGVARPRRRWRRRRTFPRSTGMNCIQPIAPAEETLRLVPKAVSISLIAGEHRGALGAEAVGGGGPLVDRDQDRRHAGARRSSSSGSRGFRRVRPGGGGGFGAPPLRLRRLLRLRFVGVRPPRSAAASARAPRRLRPAVPPLPALGAAPAGGQRRAPCWTSAPARSALPPAPAASPVRGGGQLGGGAELRQQRASAASASRREPLISPARP